MATNPSCNLCRSGSMSTCNGETLTERKSCKHYEPLSKSNSECRWLGFKLESGVIAAILRLKKSVGQMTLNN